MSLSYDELIDNNELNKIYIKAAKEIISTNDKALVANLLDLSKKVIIDYDMLKSIIKTALANNEKVKIEIVESETGKTCNCCCGKTTFKLYKNIESINIDGEDIKIKEPGLYKYLNEYLNVSLTKTYIKDITDMVVIEKK